jgi:CheY-like chemotaxis protein
VQGEGSTFWIELRQTQSPLETLGAVGPTVLPRKTTEQRSILYIEDNISNLSLIETILEEDPSIHLLTAMQGRIGLDLARQHTPDLILLDLHLPDMPGAEVLSALQADEATRNIPTVVLSADATPGQLKRLLDAGARDYITKPIDVTRFYRLMEETTARRDECVVA